MQAAFSQSPPVAAAPPRVSFLARAGPLVLARLFTAFLTLSIPLVLARAMRLEEYGTYKQLFLIAQTLYYMLPFGVAQSLYFFLPRAEEKRPYVGQTLFFLLGMAGIAAALIWNLAGPVAAAFQNPALLEYRGLLMLYVVGIIGAFPLETALTSQGRTRQSAVVYLVSDASRALVMVVPVLLGYGLRGAMIGVAGYALARVVVTWFVLLKTTRGPLWDRRLFVTQLVYAAPFGAAMVLSIGQQYAHQFVVSGSVTPELFALYAVACFQLPIVDLLYTPTSEVLMVHLGELDQRQRVHEGVEAFREAAAKLSLVFFPTAAFLFAAAPEFIAAMFGTKFLGAVPMFRVSVLGVLLAVLPMDGVLRARNETRHIFVSYLVKAAVTAPLVIFGVRWFGMMGGMLSWAIAELVGKAVLLVRVPRALSSPGHRVTVRGLLPWRALGRSSAAAAAAALGVGILRWITPAQWHSGLPDGFLWRALPLGVAGLLFLACYLAALWTAGVRPAVVLASLKRR